MTSSTTGDTAISVIMATWNNARRLRITLEALNRCAAPEGLRWELVLVANNCTDDTAPVAHSFHDRLPFVYLEEPRVTPAIRGSPRREAG